MYAILTKYMVVNPIIYSNVHNAEVVKWQTRWTQNPVGATQCGFKSRLRHQRKAIRTEVFGFFISQKCLHFIKHQKQRPNNQQLTERREDFALSSLFFVVGIYKNLSLCYNHLYENKREVGKVNR